MIFTSKNFKFIKSMAFIKNKNKNFYPFIAFGYDTNKTIEWFQQNLTDEHGLETELSDISKNPKTSYFPPSKVQLVYVDEEQSSLNIDDIVRNIGIKNISENDYTDITDVNYLSEDIIINERNHFYILVEYTISQADLTANGMDENTYINMIILSSFVDLDESATLSIIGKDDISSHKCVPLMLNLKDEFSITMIDSQMLQIKYLLSV